MEKWSLRSFRRGSWYFESSTSVVETNQDSHFLWIRADPTSRWYDALNLVVQSLVMEMVRLIVNDKASPTTGPKDESDTAPTARNEVVVLKEYHTPLESIEESPIQTTGATSQREIQEDILAVHVRESEEMDAASLRYTYQVEEEEANRLNKLKRENGRRIVNIQNDHGVRYAKGQDFQLLLEPTLAPEQQDKLAHASRRMGVFGRSIQLRKDMEREHDRIKDLCISARQYEAELDRELMEQEDQLVAVESVQETYRAQHEKIKAKRAQSARNKAALLATMTTGSTAHSSTTQKASSSFAATSSSQVSKNDDADQEMATEEHDSESQVTELLG